MLKEWSNIESIFYDGTIVTDTLEIEGTRRCGFNCAHCYHGPAENKSMLSDTLDAIFTEHKNIDYIALTGGEYSTDLNAFDKVRASLERTRPKFSYLGVFTNGMKPSRDFFDIANGIASLSENFETLVTLSNDEFHYNEYKRLGLDFEENKARFKEFKKNFGRVVFKSVPYKSKADYSESSDKNFLLYDCGNACKLKGLKKKNHEKVDSTFLRFAKLPKKWPYALMLESICYNVNGDIVKSPTSYKEGDKRSLGNINTIYNMHDFYLEHGRD